MQIQQLVTRVLGSRFQRELRKIRPVVDAIHHHEESLRGRPDAEIQAQTGRFRERIQERVGGLRAEVARLRTAKHACADPDEWDRIDRELLGQERALQKATAVVLDELLPEVFRHARQINILADHSKFHKIATFQIAPLGPSLRIFTDKGISQSLRREGRRTLDDVF